MIHILSENKLQTKDLQGIPVVYPEKAGARWKPIPHYQLATALEDGLTRKQVGITNVAWAVDASGQTLVGGFNVRLPDTPALPGLEYALGIRHSNNQKHALTFAVGATVTVCLNGLITGQFLLSRKHTTGLDLTSEINRGIERFKEEAQLVGTCSKLMRERSLTTTQSDHILMDAGRRSLLPWSRIGQVQQEYDNPRHDVFRGRSAWNLYNAFTEIAKKSSPIRQIDAISKFRQIVLN